MNIEEIMREFSLETNDIRWFLSYKLAYKIMNFKEDKNALSHYIESGELEVDLYNMEEKYILELQDLADRGKLDEVNLREIMNEISILKRKRN